MPLGFAPINVTLQIIKVAAANEKVKRHLESLGLAAGETLSVISQSKGNVILQVKGGRLAINTGVAMGIFVKEVE